MLHIDKFVNNNYLLKGDGAGIVGLKSKGKK